MIYKEGETYYHNQLHGAPCGISFQSLQQTDAASVGAEIEEDIEYRCKNCECLLYEDCQQCLYCNLKNPLEAAIEQSNPYIKQLQETMKDFKNNSY